MGDVLSAARELERSLASLLALLDARGVPSQALGQAARDCAEGFEALRASIEAGPAEARHDLADVLRSNAVTRDLVARQRGDLAAALERLRAARNSLGHLSGTTSGESCDVAG